MQSSPVQRLARAAQPGNGLQRLCRQRPVRIILFAGVLVFIVQVFFLSPTYFGGGGGGGGGASASPGGVPPLRADGTTFRQRMLGPVETFSADMEAASLLVDTAATPAGGNDGGEKPEKRENYVVVAPPSRADEVSGTTFRERMLGPVETSLADTEATRLMGADAAADAAEYHGGEALGEREAYATALVRADDDGEAAFRGALRLAKTLSEAGAALLVMVEDAKNLNATRKAALESAGNARIVDIRSVYERFAMSEEVPQEYREELHFCEVGLHPFDKFKDVFTGNVRLLMWMLWEYDQVLYMDPDTVLRNGPVNELFESCRETTFDQEASASMCAPELYDSRCHGDVAAALDLDLNETERAQDFFNPRMMLLRPRADVACKLIAAREAAMASKYPSLHREVNTMMTVLGDKWVPLEACASGVLTPEQALSEGGGLAKTYKIFNGSIAMIQGASGEKALDSLNITSEVNEIYCRLHNIAYDSFSDRLLNETIYTGHWDRYKMIRDKLESFDYVVWVDADAMVKETGFDLRDVISAAGPRADLLVNSDWEHDPGTRPTPPVNTGMMVWRRSEWSLNFLDGFLSLENEYCRKCAETYCERIHFHDQGCLEEYIMRDLRDVRSHLQIFPAGVLQRKISDFKHKIDGRLMPEWNSNYEFIVHAAGLPDKRHEVLTNASANILAELL